MGNVFSILTEHLKDPATGWSIGTFGAIAEFHRDPDEDAAITAGDGRLTLVTGRGAIRVVDHADARLVPYETVSKTPSAWSQGVMVCLPDAAAALHGRAGVTDLGADTAALMPAAEQRLYDLGFGFAHIDVCVRSADPALRAALEGGAGTPFLKLPPAALKPLKAADPVRVFASRMGRIEVAQAIPESGGVTPMGPHTHVLPDLLGRGRTQAANIPVPEGWSIVLAFYPPHPLRTADGGPKTFERDAHDRFQRLIDAHAPTALAAAKHRARAVVDGGQPPDADAVPNDRHARTAFRVALRQWEAVNGPTAASTAWRALCDPTRDDSGPDDTDPEDIRPPHDPDT